MDAYWPLPNNPAGGFDNYLNQGSGTNQSDAQYRLDQYIKNKNLLVGRFMYEQVDNHFPDGLRRGTIPPPKYRRLNTRQASTA